MSDGFGVVNLGEPDRPGEVVPPKKKDGRIEDDKDKTSQPSPGVKTDE